MTNETPAPDGGEYPQITDDDRPSRPDGDHMHVADILPEGAPDQTDAQREATDLLGLIQSQVEIKGWTSEVVMFGSDDNNNVTVLGLTSPSGRDFSLSLNPTP